MAKLEMVEFRWNVRELQVRQRSIVLEDGDIVGVSEFGDWTTVRQKRSMPAFVLAARGIVEAFNEHGVGPELPELQEAIERMKLAFANSPWSDVVAYDPEG